jgi:hypothetical protein
MIQHRPVCLWRISRIPALCAMWVALYPAIYPGSLFGQHAVDPSRRYHRLICLVHLTGSGKNGDAMRPEFVPGPADAPSRAGIIAWSMLPTDDGKMAIIHVVAVDRHAFDTIFADKRPEIKVFELGVDSREKIEDFLQAHKAGFSLDSLQVVAR